MSTSQTKFEKVVPAWYKHVVNKSLTTHEQLMNKSQKKCEQVVDK